jgi:hypothetical protein
MLRLGASSRGIGRLLAALACLAVVAACGSVAGGAGRVSAARSPAAVAGPASDAGAAGRARTGSASSPLAGPPVAGAGVKHFDFLDGVSCASPANCTAVGDYYRTASGPRLTLIERWNGTAWQVEPSPGIGRGSALDSVSCPSATRCTAVGSLILGWNGASWKVELASSSFAGVCCAAPSSCMAVGVTAGGQPESGYFNGTSWTLEPMPRPAHPGAKHHPGRSLPRRAGLLSGGRGLLLRRGRHAQPHGQGQDPRRTVERIVLAGHRHG